MQRLLLGIVVTALAGTLAAAGQGATTPPQSKAQKAQKPARDPAAVQPATGTAALAGILVAADTGKPLRRAQIRLTCPDPRIVCAWFDPSLLRQLSSASVAISLREGEQKVQALRANK